VTRRFFRGESRHKVDSKGRVSIPASFRRVLEAGDPDWVAGLNPTLVIVYGDENRNYLECYSMQVADDVATRISLQKTGTAKRVALERLYNTLASEMTLDETGRLVLPSRLRNKIGLKGEAFFAGTGDTFKIWHPDTYEKEIATLAAGGGLDPDVDPSIYLDDGAGG